MINSICHLSTLMKILELLNLLLSLYCSHFLVSHFLLVKQAIPKFTCLKVIQFWFLFNYISLQIQKDSYSLITKKYRQMEYLLSWMFPSLCPRVSCRQLNISTENDIQNLFTGRTWKYQTITKEHEKAMIPCFVEDIEL